MLGYIILIIVGVIVGVVIGVLTLAGFLAEALVKGSWKWFNR